MPAPPSRILFVRFSHLGDVIQSLPVVHAVARAWPEARLAFATQAAYAPLLAGLPQLERVLTFDREGGPGAWWHFRRDARAFGPTWAIDCQGNWKSAWATWLSGARRRSGLAREHWREGSARVLCNDLVPDGSRAVHAVERQLALARHVTAQAGTWPALDSAPALDATCALEANRTLFDLALTADELHAGRALLGTAEHPALLHLAKPGDPRSWPAERFLELAQALAARGRATLVLAGPDEAELRPTLAALPRMPHLHVLGESPDLRTLAALFAAAAERGGTLVGCDSGPSHLAAAVGLPVVHLFGPQAPERTGPWPASAHVHVTAERELACRPCLARECALSEGPVCLGELRVEAVLAALD